MSTPTTSRTDVAGRGFAGKVAVITGAGSGIGRALAVNLAGRGARLALSDVDPAGLDATAEQCRFIGAQVRSDRLDVTERADVHAYAAAVRAHFGVVHQIYNNAGVTHYGQVERVQFKDIERVFDVNFWGVVNGTKAFLPHVLESGNGHVVNISSLFGLITFPGQNAYNASKFAVRGFTEALRQEMLVSRQPVHVTCVHPGGIKTSVARNATVTEGFDAQSLADVFDRRMAYHSPEMAARTIVRGVRRRKARVLIGAEAKALDLMARIAPAGSQRIGVLMSRFMPVAER